MTRSLNLPNATLWELYYFSVQLSAEIISLRTRVLQKGNVRKLLWRLFLEEPEGERRLEKRKRRWIDVISIKTRGP